LGVSLIPLLQSVFATFQTQDPVINPEKAMGLKLAFCSSENLAIHKQLTDSSYRFWEKEKADKTLKGLSSLHLGIRLRFAFAPNKRPIQQLHQIQQLVLATSFLGAQI